MIVIGIDELDKMDSVEEARRFLNDIKLLFGQPRAYYLISLSDDAMAAFEQRGLPLRDVFESVFDDVIRVEPLDLNESGQLLQRRVVGMAPPFVGLCHALSGGLPRELIRTARDAVRSADTQEDSDLGGMARQLVNDRAQARQRAASVVAARAVTTIGIQPVLEWLRDLESDPSAAQLLDRTAVAPVVLDLRVVSEQAQPQLELLVMQLAAAWYHGASVVEFFSNTDEAGYLAAVEESDSRGNALDLLARGALDLSIAPHQAWITTSEFRRRVGLGSLDYPLSVETTTESAV